MTHTWHQPPFVRLPKALPDIIHMQHILYLLEITKADQSSPSNRKITCSQENHQHVHTQSNHEKNKLVSIQTPDHPRTDERTIGDVSQKRKSVVIRHLVFRFDIPRVCQRFSLLFALWGRTSLEPGVVLRGARGGRS